MRWLATGTAALILAAACSGGSTSNQAPTTITFAYLDAGTKPDQSFQQASTAFHKAHPDIEVKGVKIPNTLAAVTAGNAADVVQVNRDWLGQFIASGDLREFSADEVQRVGGKDAFIPQAWPGGNPTSIPWFIDTRAVYYRTDILQQLNIDPANAFSNWEAFDHTLDAIKISGKISPFGIAGKNDSNIAGSFAPWIWEAGGSLLSDDGKKATINEQRSVDGVDEFQRFGGRYVASAVLQQDSTGVDAMFAAGKFAVTISGPGLAAKLQNVKYGTAPFPSGHAGHVVYVGGSNLGILKSSKHASAALEWVRWLVDGENDYVQRLGMYPALAAAAPPGAFSEQIKVGRSFPALATWPRIQAALAPDLGKIWDQVIAGGEPMAKDQLQTLLDNAARDMQTAIA